MNVVVLQDKSNSKVLIRPIGAGQIGRSDEYYVMESDTGVLNKIDDSMVPCVQLVADGGGFYWFKRQNGWMVDLPCIMKASEKWMAWEVDGDVQISGPTFKLKVIEDKLKVKVRNFFFFGYYEWVSLRLGFRSSAWFWFPWHRTFFLDDDRDGFSCLPFANLLFELRNDLSTKKLAYQWSIGLRVISDAFQLPKDLVWKIPGAH